MIDFRKIGGMMAISDSHQGARSENWEMYDEVVYVCLILLSMSNINLCVHIVTEFGSHPNTVNNIIASCNQ